MMIAIPALMLNWLEQVGDVGDYFQSQADASSIEG
jgi:hypothetical protein